MIKLVFGVGFNDSVQPIRPIVNGKQVPSPHYQAWKGMLRRCYSQKEHLRYPSYAGCTAWIGWHKFSEFKSWMDTQDWDGKELDKDLLVPGNKVYSPETCLFVSSQVNLFLVDGASRRGGFMLGAYLDKRTGKFRSSCNNPFTRTQEYLGTFSTEISAHLAWKVRKHELACLLADLEKDSRTAAALRSRFLQPEEIAA